MELPHWIHKHDGRLIDVINIPNKAIGFVYIIRFTDNTYYIGKKLVRTREMKPALLNGKPRDNHIRFLSKIKKRKKVAYEELHKELSWHSYIGSQKYNGSYKNNDVKSREILSFCSSKKQMAYEENYLLYVTNAISCKSCRNANISGTFFASSDIVESIEKVKKGVFHDTVRQCNKHKE